MPLETYEVRLADDNGNLSNPISHTFDIQVSQLTQFGSAIDAYPNTGLSFNQAIAAHEADCGAPIDMLRIYDGGVPTNWNTPSAVSGSRAPGAVTNSATREFWHSVKLPLTYTRAQVSSWVRSYGPTIPRRVVGGRVLKTMVSTQHEAAVKNYDATTWKQLQVYFMEEWKAWAAEAGRSDEFEVGPIYTGRWRALNPNTAGFVEADYMSTALGALADFVAFDPYNEASKPGNDNWSAQYQDPAYYLTHMQDLFNQYFPGVPWAIGETGYVANPNDLTMKPTWITALINYTKARNYRAVCWFDCYLVNPWWLRRNTSLGWIDTVSAPIWGAQY